MNFKITPDPEPRNSPFHKKIAQIDLIPDRASRRLVILECGHRFLVFGNIDHANGVLFCEECQKNA